MPRIRGTCRPEAGRLQVKSTGKGKRNLKGSFERAEAQMGQAVLQLPERHADKLYTKYVKESLKSTCRWRTSSPSETFRQNLEERSSNLGPQPCWPRPVPKTPKTISQLLGSGRSGWQPRFPPEPSWKQLLLRAPFAVGWRVDSAVPSRIHIFCIKEEYPWMIFQSRSLCRDGLFVPVVFPPL